MRYGLSLASMLLVATACFAADLPPAAKTDFTMHDFRKASLEYDQRTMSGAYQKVGQRDAKYDADVVRILDSMAVRFNDLRVGFPYESTADTSAVALLPQCQLPTLMACKDPMFLYVKAIIYKDSKLTAQYETIIKQMAPVMLQSQYPPLRKYYTLQKWLTIKDPSRTKEQTDQYAARQLVELANYLLEPMDQPIERRLKAKIILDDFQEFKATARERVLQIVEASPQSDPWIRNFLSGVHEYALAWESRGGGFANKVKEEGWKGYHEHLPRARRALEAAYKLEPSYPESSMKMIQVAMSLGTEDCSTREWFDRAIAAQIDYKSAWNVYRWAIQPRWGGSHKQMYDLGKEALQTGRFDTDVPFQLIDCVYAIKKDKYPDDEGYDLTNGAWNDIKAMFEGYYKAAPPKMNLNGMRTNQLGYAYWCQAYEACAELLDQLKDKVDPAWLYKFNVPVEDIRAETNAMLSDKSTEMRRARRLEYAEKYPKAAQLYKRVAETLNAQHPAWKFVNQKIYNCEVLAKLHSGVRVDLPLKQPDALTFWRDQEKASWKQGPDYLEFATQIPGWCLLHNTCPVSNDVRVKLEWNYSSINNAPLTWHVYLGRMSVADGGYLGVEAFPKQNKVQIGNNNFHITGSVAENVDLRPDVWHTWVIERRGEVISVEHDGKIIIDHVSRPWNNAGAPVLALYAVSKVGGYSVRVRNMSIEELGE